MKAKIEAIYYHFQGEDKKDITKVSKIRVSTGDDKYIDIYVNKETGAIEMRGTDEVSIKPIASNSLAVELVKRR